MGIGFPRAITFVADLPNSAIKRFEYEFFKFMEKNFPDIEKEIETKNDLDDALTNKLEQAVLAFKADFQQSINR